MKFAATEEISAPIEQVFADLSNFRRFEREAIKNGIELRRKDNLTQPGPGMGWEARFIARGKPRELNAEVTEFTDPDKLAFSGKIGGMTGFLVLELQSISENLTELNAVLDLKPKSFSARVLIQSMKIARGSIAKRFRKAVRKFSRRLERRLAKR